MEMSSQSENTIDTSVLRDMSSLCSWDIYIAFMFNLVLGDQSLLLCISHVSHLPTAACEGPGPGKTT